MTEACLLDLSPPAAWLTCGGPRVGPQLLSGITALGHKTYLPLGGATPTDLMDGTETQLFPLQAGGMTYWGEGGGGGRPGSR